MNDGLISSFEGRSAMCVVSLSLRQEVVSQAPQHYRSSEVQATCDDCFVGQFRSFLLSSASSEDLGKIFQESRDPTGFFVF